VTSDGTALGDRMKSYEAVTRAAPHFTLAPDGFLAEVIPPLPSLRDAA